jgi:hypothetical protein
VTAYPGNQFTTFPPRCTHHVHLPPQSQNDAAFTAHGAPARDRRSWGVVLTDEPVKNGPGQRGRVAAYVQTDAVADLGPVIAALAAACSPRDEA